MMFASNDGSLLMLILEKPNSEEKPNNKGRKELVD